MTTNADAGGPIAGEIMHSIAAGDGWPDYHPTVHPAISVDPKILAQYVRTFALAPNFDLAVTVENGQLIAQATGQSKVPLCAESETRFFSIVIGAEIEFFKDRQVNVTHLVLHQGGHGMKAPNNLWWKSGFERARL
ncbi:MAG: hypothetical protein ABSG62_12960 [Terracidiphilus sp.]